MHDLVLPWRPPIPVDPRMAVEAIDRYLDHESTFVLFENGTALVLKPHLDRPEVIASAMNEVRFKTDFNVMPMRDGNFIVWLASPVVVFISASEVAPVVDSLRADPTVALYPGENFVASAKNPDHHLLGLAGRAKAHLDSRNQRQVARHAAGSS